MSRITPRTPDSRVRILQIPVYGGNTNPYMAERGNVASGIFIGGHFPQFVVSIEEIDPVRQPEFLIHPEHPIPVAIAAGFAWNAVRVDHGRVTNFPFAPAGLGKAERHVVVRGKGSAVGAVELHKFDLLPIAQNVGVEDRSAAVEAVDFSIVIGPFTAKQRRAAGRGRQTQRAAQRRYEDVVIRHLVRFLVLVIKRQRGCIACLLRRLLHEPFGVPGTRCVGFVSGKIGVGIPSALAIDEIEGVFGDVAETIDEPDSGSVVRARHRKSPARERRTRWLES